MKHRDQVKTELEYYFNEMELRKWKCYSYDKTWQNIQYYLKCSLLSTNKMFNVKIKIKIVL